MYYHALYCIRISKQRLHQRSAQLHVLHKRGYRSRFLQSVHTRTMQTKTIQRGSACDTRVSDIPRTASILREQFSALRFGDFLHKCKQLAALFIRFKRRMRSMHRKLRMCTSDAFF